MSEKKTNALKTKCYYTDYINHAIRFYLSTPDGLDLRQRSYTNASVQNWNAVQLVFIHLDPEDNAKLREIYGRASHLPRSVEAYSKEHGLDEEEVWKMITKVSSKIARVRGLI